MKEGEPEQIVCPYANMSSYASVSDDEINWLDIWNVLWRRRFLILLGTLLITAIASVYAFLAPKSYETKIVVVPPLNLGIEKLLVNLTDGNEIVPTPKTVFDIVKMNINDRTIQAKFWSENKNKSIKMSKKEFIKNLSIEIPGKKKNGMVTVSLIGAKPDKIAIILNDYISFINDYSGRIIIETLKFNLEVKKLAIGNKIDSLRIVANKKTESEIAELEEQKAIAEKLRITERSKNLIWRPLYLRGTKALQVEIDTLKQRKTTDIFIARLPLLQEELQRLENLDFNSVKLRTMLAETASFPRKKTKQSLIVALGGIAGLMLSIFMILLMNFFSGKVKTDSDSVQ